MCEKKDDVDKTWQNKKSREDVCQPCYMYSISFVIRAIRRSFRT